ncbi:MAG: LuxR C-terminal-related transcriptional regulator [Sphingomonas sp.]
MQGNARKQSRSVGSEPVALPHLTPTQLKVLDGVNSGLLNKQIAYNLGIAEATVKAHMTALMRKLKVRNRTQVAIAARALAASIDLAH